MSDPTTTTAAPATGSLPPIDVSAADDGDLGVIVATTLPTLSRLPMLLRLVGFAQEVFAGIGGSIREALSYLGALTRLAG